MSKRFGKVFFFLVFLEQNTKRCHLRNAQKHWKQIWKRKWEWRWGWCFGKKQQLFRSVLSTLDTSGLHLYECHGSDSNFFFVFLLCYFTEKRKGFFFETFLLSYFFTFFFQKKKKKNKKKLHCGNFKKRNRGDMKLFGKKKNRICCRGFLSFLSAQIKKQNCVEKTKLLFIFLGPVCLRSCHRFFSPKLLFLFPVSFSGKNH